MLLTRIKVIEKDVDIFLNAFLKIPKNEFKFQLLDEFPTACCEFSSLLLAKFLVEVRKYDDIQVKIITGRAKKDNFIIHLWLEVFGITVDITAHQFDHAPQQTIVTVKSSWHTYFKIIKRESPEISFENLDDEPKEELESDYLRILSLLDC